MALRGRIHQVRPFKSLYYFKENFMSASGELIRMMNYVDDIAATLRRIQGALAFIEPEEKKRLAEYMKNANPNYSGIVQRLEAGE